MFRFRYAAVVKLVYTLVSGTSGATRGGSSPLRGTSKKALQPKSLFMWYHRADIR